MLRKLSLSFMITFFALSSVLGGDTNHRLVVKISGLETDEGKVFIALFNSAEAFDDGQGDAILHEKLEVKNGKAEWNVNALEPGEYAFKLFHDENNNEIMDKSMIGIPKESYAFSNNAPARFGPAKYKDAVFEIKDSLTIQEIIIN